jgi:chromosome segregation ATPase
MKALLRLITVFVLMVATFTSAFAQQLSASPASAPEVVILQSILNELKSTRTELQQLRAELKKIISINQHLQLAFDEFRLHQDRVTRLKNEVNQQRAAVSDAEAMKWQMTALIERLEQQLNSDIDARHRAEIEALLKDTKAALEALNTRLNEQTNTLAKLNFDLAAEEALLAEAKARIERLRNDIP